MKRKLLISYRKKDFRVDTFASGGKGGQHQNKTQSGVRIVHLPTGLSSECRETRNQGRNKKIAFRRLANKIKIWHQKQIRNNHEISNETIRTYHAVDNRVKDHLSGFQSTYSEVVENEYLDEMIEKRRFASVA